MNERIRRRGPDGKDIIADIPHGPVTVYRPFRADSDMRTLAEAIPPKRENLQFINLDTAAKYAPGDSPTFHRRSA